MADLTKAFDFRNPDYSIPSMPNISYPSTDSKGNWNGDAVCESTYKTQRPPVPYGKQNVSTSLVSEQGSKAVRGQLTEGRYLVFEMNGHALAYVNGTLCASKATSKHNDKSQRFVIHASGSTFTMTSATNGSSVFASSSTSFTFNDMGNGKGYSILVGGKYLSISKGKVSTSSSPTAGFSVFSVTYN